MLLMHTCHSTPTYAPVPHNATTLESCLCFPQLLSQIFVNGSCNEINSPAVAQKHGNVLGASILLSAVPEQTFECEFSLNILNSISCMLWRVIFPADEYQYHSQVGMKSCAHPHLNTFEYVG